jgi:restriction system protein
VARGFFSGLNQLSRELERQARASARDAARSAREQARLEREARIASARDEKERKRDYLESRAEEAAGMTEEAEARIGELSSILADGIRSRKKFSLDCLIVKPNIPVLNLEDLETPNRAPVDWEYVTPRPSWFFMLLGGKAKYEREKEASDRKRQQALRKYEADEALRLGKIEARKAEYTAEVARIKRQADEHNKTIDECSKALRAHNPDAISGYFSAVLSHSSLPEGFPQSSVIVFSPESRQLVVNYDVPPFETITPDVKAVKHVKATDTFSHSKILAAQRKQIYASIIAQTTLRCLHEIFQADTDGNIDTTVLSVYVDTINPATGQNTRYCVVSVRTTKDTFAAIDLSRVDPMACLQQLNASVSRNPAELAPVRPILELNMNDPRFITESDILSGLDERQNLMDLTPGEFESLITNLFQKMGLETKLTQASRDGGVDCIAYDPRPIFGGKVVIQAKRYKNTVGVSAVRDLFGTMQNEGASKGILVATSGYGKASFEFANNKPIELLDGANLLYLLQKHAGVDARIVMPVDD